MFSRMTLISLSVFQVMPSSISRFRNILLGDGRNKIVRNEFNYTFWIDINCKTGEPLLWYDP